LRHQPGQPTPRQTIGRSHITADQLHGDPLYGYGPLAQPSFAPLMRLTNVVIDRAGNIWALNNWKPAFDIDVCCNPGGDGAVIFVGIAPPPAAQK